MFSVNCIFSLVILSVIQVSLTLVPLPHVENNDILKTEDVIRSTTNILFSSLGLNKSTNPKLEQFNLVHNYFISIALLDYHNLKEIAKLTRFNKTNIDKTTKHLIAVINKISKRYFNLNKITSFGLHATEKAQKKAEFTKAFYNDNELDEIVLKILEDDTNKNYVKKASLRNESSTVQNNEYLFNKQLAWRDHNVGRRLYNAKSTKIKHYGFMASVEIFGRFQCAGNIIKSDLVITAASCLQLAHNNRFFRENPPFLTVRVGSTYFEVGGEVIKVIEVYFYPTYDPKTLRHNIAIIRLHRRLRFHKKAVKKIEIDDADSNLPHNVGRITIVGWGAKTASNALGNPWKSKLRHAEIDIYDLHDCQDIYSKEYVTSKNFCAGSISHGSGACNRDLGGPGIAHGKLVGIISFGAPVCGTPDAPTVFVNVGYYYDWIQDIMEQEVPYVNQKTTLKPTTYTYGPPKTEYHDKYRITPINKKQKEVLIGRVNTYASRYKKITPPQNKNMSIRDFLKTMFTDEEINQGLENMISRSNISTKETFHKVTKYIYDNPYFETTTRREIYSFNPITREKSQYMTPNSVIAITREPSQYMHPNSFNPVARELSQYMTPNSFNPVTREPSQYIPPNSFNAITRGPSQYMTPNSFNPVTRGPSQNIPPISFNAITRGPSQYMTPNSFNPVTREPSQYIPPKSFNAITRGSSQYMTPNSFNPVTRGPSQYIPPKSFNAINRGASQYIKLTEKKSFSVTTPEPITLGFVDYNGDDSEYGGLPIEVINTNKYKDTVTSKNKDISMASQDVGNLFMFTQFMVPVTDISLATQNVENSSIYTQFMIPVTDIARQPSNVANKEIQDIVLEYLDQSNIFATGTKANFPKDKLILKTKFGIETLNMREKEMNLSNTGNKTKKIFEEEYKEKFDEELYTDLYPLLTDNESKNDTLKLLLKDYIMKIINQKEIITNIPEIITKTDILMGMDEPTHHTTDKTHRNRPQRLSSSSIFREDNMMGRNNKNSVTDPTLLTQTTTKYLFKTAGKSQDNRPKGGTSSSIYEGHNQYSTVKYNEYNEGFGLPSTLFYSSASHKYFSTSSGKSKRTKTKNSKGRSTQGILIPENNNEDFYRTQSTEFETSQKHFATTIDKIDKSEPKLHSYPFVRKKKRIRHERTTLRKMVNQVELTNYLSKDDIADIVQKKIIADKIIKSRHKYNTEFKENTQNHKVQRSTNANGERRLRKRSRSLRNTLSTGFEMQVPDSSGIQPTKKKRRRYTHSARSSISL